MSLLSGPVVFIDDEINQAESAASELAKAIQSSGRPVLAAEALPSRDTRQEWFEHWQNLSFVVVDWDLSPGSNGGMGSSTLGDYERAKLFEFLKDLMARIYCPIFIISREDVADIQRQINENRSVLDSAGQVDRRISIFPKEVLMEDIVGHLAAQVAASPALSVLRQWEYQFDAARNRLFIDFNEIEPDWPIFVWRMSEKDGVDPAYELSSLISANLLTRVEPVQFDEAITDDPQQEVTSSAMRRVWQGRTLVPASRLPGGMVFPGDVFRFDQYSPDEVWINVSPVCQTVARPSSDDKVVARIPLHLIRGRRVEVGSKKQFDRLTDIAKGPTGEVVHTFLDESPYHFQFKEVEIHLLDDVKDLRIGRLLPPYVTRFQQKYSAYLQAEGLPRVEYGLYKPDAPIA